MTEPYGCRGMSDRWLGPWPLWMVIFGLIFGAALVLSSPQAAPSPMSSISRRSSSLVVPAPRIGCPFAGLLFFQPVVRCAEPKRRDAKPTGAQDGVDAAFMG